VSRLAGEGRGFGRAGWSIFFLSLLFFFMVGFVFPGSDMMLILPRLSADAPTSWSLDPYFSRPADSYLFIDLLFRLGGRILPLVVLLPALSLLSAVLLATAVLDLARQEAGDCFAPLSIGLAVLATGVATLGNMLLGDAYHPQFTAFGFAALAAAASGRARWLKAALLLVAAGLFHPLIGLYGLLFPILGILDRRPAPRDLIGAILPALGVVALAVAPAVSGGGLLNDATAWRAYVRLLIFLRAPHHHLPFVWPPAEFFFFAMITIVAFMATTRRLIRWWILALACLALLGVLNNGLSIRQPTLVIANPLKMAPLVLVLFWAGVARLSAMKTGSWRRIILMLLLIGAAWRLAAGSYPGPIAVDPAEADWKAICAAAREQTRPGACVVVPPERDDFQWRSGRAAFFTWKHFPFEPRSAIDWAERGYALKVIPATARPFDRLDKAIGPASADLSDTTLRLLQDSWPGVDYAILSDDEETAMKILATQGRFRLCRLSMPEGEGGP
jgi:hypothetical protein